MMHGQKNIKLCCLSSCRFSCVTMLVSCNQSLICVFVAHVGLTKQGCDMIYLLTASALPPSGSCTIHIYTQTIHITTQNKQYIEQYKNFGRVQAVPQLGELYPGICLTTEEKARKTLSQGSRTIRICKPNNKII